MNFFNKKNRVNLTSFQSSLIKSIRPISFDQINLKINLK